MFIPAKWFQAGSGTTLCRLSTLKYYWHEFADRQQTDSTSQWFVDRVLQPQARGDSTQAGCVHPDDPSELAAMIAERDKYYIFRSGGANSYALLMYENRRAFVPQSYRHALIQAPHAAMHKGMGDTRYLLEGAFY